jgi:protein required for attachment to host cells
MFEDFPTDDEVPEITEDPKEHAKEVNIADRFSLLINRQLEHYAKQNLFDRLILCAEPQYLEILKSHLDPQLQKKVIGIVELDLYEANESDLINYVKDILIPAA